MGARALVYRLVFPAMRFVRSGQEEGIHSEPCHGWISLYCVRTPSLVERFGERRLHVEISELGGHYRGGAGQEKMSWL